jgi:hypothetical protein
MVVIKKTFQEYINRIENPISNNNEPMITDFLIEIRPEAIGLNLFSG